MKNIIITIPESSIARNIFRTYFWQDFKEKNKSNQIILIVPPEKLDSYRKEFGNSKNIKVLGLNVREKSFLEKITKYLAMNAFYSPTMIVMRNRSYLDGKKFPPVFIKNLLAFLFDKSHLFKKIIRFLELRVETDKMVCRIFRKYKPDIVISTLCMNTKIDIPILREAKKNNIKSIGMVRSWDNLTSYGFLRVVPDYFLAQNRFLKNKAITKHSVPSENIDIFGLPHYDYYKKNRATKSKEEFFKEMGLDLKKHLILYMAVGDFLFPKEGEIADLFEEIIENGNLDFDAQVIFRAHPAFSSPLDKIREMKHVTPDRPAKYQSNNLSTWEMDKSDEEHFVNSVKHSDILVTAGGTAMIDGTVFNKPVITIAFESKSKVDYWFSIARLHDHMVHIVSLIKTGGVRVANNKEELVNYLNMYQKNPLLDTNGRHEIMGKYVEPFDGRAGLRLSDLINGYIQKQIR